MPILFRPQPAAATLLYQFSGKLSLADLASLALLEEPHFQALEPGACLYVVIDVSGLETIAAAYFPAVEQLHMTRNAHVCMVSVVGANPYLRALALSLGMVHNRRTVEFYATLDDAFAAIHAHRSTRFDGSGMPPEPNYRPQSDP